MKLGENASAMTLADRGLAVNPIEKDALHGPWSLEVFARVTAATGDHDRAIAALKKLLSIPYEGPLLHISRSHQRYSNSIRCLIPYATIRVSKR